MRRPSPTEKVDRRGTLSLPVTRKRAPRPFAVSGCLGIRPLSSALPLPPPFATFCPLLPHHLGPMVGCPGACCTGCKIGWAFPLMHIPYGPQSAHSPLHFYALCAVVRTFPLYLLPCSPLLSIQSDHSHCAMPQEGQEPCPLSCGSETTGNEFISCGTAPFATPSPYILLAEVSRGRSWVCTVVHKAHAHHMCTGGLRLSPPSPRFLCDIRLFTAHASPISDAAVGPN
jgi:hypothetical protein